MVKVLTRPSLLRKIKIIKNDLSEAREIYKVYEKFFLERLDLYCASNNIENPLYQDRSTQAKSNIHDSDFDVVVETEEFKQTWRKMLKAFHPDKNGDANTLDRILKAKKENDLAEIIEVSRESGIDMPSSLCLEEFALNNQYKRLRDELDALYNSYPWNFFVADEIKREKILISFIRSFE